MLLSPATIGAIQQDPIRRIFKQASLDLRFADNKSLVDATTGAQLVTFTRASSGTFAGSDGVLRTAVTNLLLRSEEFDNASWAKLNNVTVTANATTAPNGFITADKIVEPASSADKLIVQPVTLIANTTYTASVYFKAADRPTILFHVRKSDYSTRFGGFFNTSTNVFTAETSGGGVLDSFTFTNVGGGWYRCSITGNIGANTAGIVTIYLANSSNNLAYTGDGTSGIYLWGAQLEQSSTVGEYIPTTSTINSAPRFDHNPTTGESLGLLVEEQRTNSIRNNTMVGAVAGTPGTLPTNWILVGALPSGVTQEVVGIGTERGINFVDIKWSGTPGATAAVTYYFEATGHIAASNGQVWTESFYHKLAAGSTANVGLDLRLIVRAADLAGVNDKTQAITPSANLVRITDGTVTITSALAVSMHPGLRVSFTSGAAIDITLRIGLPQLELGAFATSVIPTTTAAATRSADVANITGTAFSSWYRQDEGSVYWEGTRNRTTGFPERFSLNDGTANNRIFSYFDAAANSSTFTVVTSSVNQGDIFGGGGALNSNLKTGFGFALNNVSAIYSGGVQNTDTTVTLPIVNQLVIGNGLGGTIRRISFWPTRLSNSTLQTLTQ